MTEISENNRSKGLEIASLVLGIAGLVFACIPLIGLLLGIIGLSLGIFALIKAKRYNLSKNMVTAALLLSVFAIIIGSLWLGYLIENSDGDLWRQIQDLKNNDGQYFDINDELNELDQNFDSLTIDDDEFDQLEKSMDDLDNGPGPAPGE